MKKQIYTTPAVEVTEVKVEGMIAASLPLGSTGGSEQLIKDDSNWDIWSAGN